MLLININTDSNDLKLIILYYTWLDLQAIYKKKES